MCVEPFYAKPQGLSRRYFGGSVKRESFKLLLLPGAAAPYNHLATKQSPRPDA